MGNNKENFLDNIFIFLKSGKHTSAKPETHKGKQNWNTKKFKPSIRNFCKERHYKHN